jgi:TolB protein
MKTFLFAIGWFAISQLSSLQAAAAKSDMRLYAMNEDGANVREITAIPGFEVICSPEPSPDGKWVAVDGWAHDQTLRDAKLLFVNLETGEGRNHGTGCMPSWSADSKWFGYSKYGEGVFVKAFDGSHDRLIDPAGWAIQLSPDGTKAAYSSGGNLIIYDFIGATKRPIFPEEELRYGQIYWNCKWSPDSKKICFQGALKKGGDEIAIVSVEGDPNLRVYCSGDEYHEDIAWHPSGTRILLPRKKSAKEPAQIDEFNPDWSDKPWPLKGQPTDRHNGGLGWSHDGKTLYFISWEK